MNIEWYYARGGKRFGPFSVDQIQNLLASNRLSASDHVWRDGFASWISIADCSEISVPALPIGQAIPVKPPPLVQPVETLQPPPISQAVGAAWNLSCLALRGVAEWIGGDALSESAGGLLHRVRKTFQDQSHLLPRALERANTKAWQTLEMSLAEDGFWVRVKQTFSQAEDIGMLQEIRKLMESLEAPNVKNKNEFRKKCLAELRHAQAKGLLEKGDLSPEALAEGTAKLARFASPEDLIDNEWQIVDQLANGIKSACPNLSFLLRQKPTNGKSLLTIAVQYYFRREVEENEQLFRGITFSRLESLSQSQEKGFSWLANKADQIQSLLSQIQQTVESTHEGVLRIEEELRKQDPQFQKMYQMLLEIQTRLDLRGPALRSGTSFSIRTDDERQQVKAFLAKYRSIPEKSRRKRPALLNAVAKLEVATGDFQSAEDDFAEVATLVTDKESQAEVHHNRYLAYLESGQWKSALQALNKAVQLDSDRFAPFPMHKYEPRSILGAGGFGVAFLCENVNMGAQVVLKTLRTEGNGTDVQQALREARVLARLQHPAIIQLFDCDFVDDAKTRAYMVMEFFHPQTLASHVETHGPVSVETFLSLAQIVAQGLQVAHEQGILHRDIKPENILVRQSPNGWEVKLIDFGLAVMEDATRMKVSTKKEKSTATGGSIAGTLEYAAPEQLGRLPDVKVGPYSDIYGFGKTCCYALFKTTQPLPRHFRGLPDTLIELLEDCLEENPNKRPQSFRDVVNRLQSIGRDEKLPEVEAISEVVPVGQPILETQWYFTRFGQRQGPVAESALKSMLANGQLSETEMVWCTGMREWVPANTVDRLVVLQVVQPSVNQSGYPSWVVSHQEFAEATHKLWLSGRCGSFAPDYQEVAKTQPLASFYQDVKNSLEFFEDHDLPLFKDEVWLVGSSKQTCRLTTYRLILTTPELGIVVLPLHEIEQYSFKGASGSVRGWLLGSEVMIRGKFGKYHWTGESLQYLHFPIDSYFHGARVLRMWRKLPPNAMNYLASPLSALRGVPN